MSLSMFLAVAGLIPISCAKSVSCGLTPSVNKRCPCCTCVVGSLVRVVRNLSNKGFIIAISVVQRRLSLLAQLNNWGLTTLGSFISYWKVILLSCNVIWVLFGDTITHCYVLRGTILSKSSLESVCVRVMSLMRGLCLLLLVVWKIISHVAPRFSLRNCWNIWTRMCLSPPVWQQCLIFLLKEAYQPNGPLCLFRPCSKGEMHKWLPIIGGWLSPLFLPNCLLPAWMSC